MHYTFFKYKKISFHIHHYGADYTLECIRSYIPSRKTVLGPAPRHRCTLVSWQEHISGLQHWNIAHHQRTWSRGLKHCHNFLGYIIAHLAWFVDVVADLLGDWLTDVPLRRGALAIAHFSSFNGWNQ